MSFLRHKDKTSQVWLVDMDGVQHLIRSCVRARAVLNRSHTEYQPQEMGILGAMPGLGLTLVTVQTNFDGLGNQIDKELEPILKDFERQLHSSGKNAFDTLVGLRNQTVKYNEAFRKKQMDASIQTNSAINRSLGNSAAAEKFTRFIRDTSGNILMVGAAILTGGAALAVLGGATVLKGSFTFEDKKLEGGSTAEAVGMAGLEISTDLVVGVIGMGEREAASAALAAKPAQGAKLAAGVIVLIGSWIDGMSEFAKAAVDGKTVRQGLLAAGTRAGLHIATAGLSPKLDNLFSTETVEGLSFASTVTKPVAKKLAEDTAVADLSDTAVKATGSDSSSSRDSGAWHQSLACTYAPLADSDVVYVEQHAMKPSSRHKIR
jgi:ElaB/YqjD/DUF883 family membrane-anchored ribosome-binding protein